MSVGAVQVLFVASALFCTGAFALVWRREAGAALAGLPLMLGAVGLAFAGVSRFAASRFDPVAGQGLAVVLAVAALCWVALGLSLIGREGSR
jgi:NADH:ubiquinone oxidoreductase subunit K